MAVTKILGYKQIRESTITTALLADSAITTAKIAGGAVKDAQIFATTITAASIYPTTITAAEIMRSTVTAAQLENTTVTTGKINRSAITTDKLANTAVTAAKIYPTTITAAQIAPTTITAAKIYPTTITAAQIAPTTITAAKIARTTITSEKLATSITIKDLTVSRKAVFNGTTVIINSTTLVVHDPMITVGWSTTGSSAIVPDNGLEVDRGSGTSNAMIFFHDDIAASAVSRKWYLNNGDGVNREIMTGGSLGNFVVGEVHSNTTRSTISLGNPPVTGSLSVFFNGQRWRAGATEDYTLSGAVITLIAASVIDPDVVLADYRY